MSTPDNPYFEERLITEEVFTRLRDAARNLFEFGPHANQQYAVFGDIVIEDGMAARFDRKKLQERPTHIYSGMIHPYGSRIPSYQVWKKFEGSGAREGYVLNSIAIEPSFVVREDDICEERNRGMRRDFVLSMSGRAFELMSTLPPNFMHAELGYELDDTTASQTADLLDYLVEKARASAV
jgi:hypothetical protein